MESSYSSYIFGSSELHYLFAGSILLGVLTSHLIEIPFQGLEIRYFPRRSKSTGMNHDLRWRLEETRNTPKNRLREQVSRICAGLRVTPRLRFHLWSS